MTISYLDSKRINGLSTDVSNTPTVSDDFTSYTTQGSADAVWVPNDSARMRVNITNDNLDFNSIMDNTEDQIAYDLGSVSDTSWVLRFKLRFSTLTTSSNNALYIGLSSTDYQGGYVDTQDVVCLYIHHSGVIPSRYGVVHGNGSSFGTGSYSSMQAVVWATATDYFFQLTRLSATQFQIKRYSDSTYASVVDNTSVVTIDSGISSLRYLKLCNTQTSESGVIQGTIDDIKFYNGVISLTNKPTNVQTNSLFTETDVGSTTFFDGTIWNYQGYLPLSSTAGWSNTDSNCQVVPATQTIDFTFANNTPHNISYDLGAGNISSSAFVLRCKIRFSTLSRGLLNQYFHFGFSNSDYTVNYTGTQSAFGVLPAFHPYTPVGDSCYPTSPSASNQSFENTTQDGSFTSVYTWLINTDYYFQVRILSASTWVVELYTDPAYTSLLRTTGTMTMLNTPKPSGLRYFFIKNLNGFDGTGNATGKMSLIYFKNGVSSI